MSLPRFWGFYELLELLSEGRVASTYLAREREAEDASAASVSGLLSLKALHPFADVAEQRASLLREAELQSLCSHPGVVRIVEGAIDPSGRADRGRCIVRRYVSGFSLSELYHAGVRVGLPLEVVAALGDVLLEILGAVHETGSGDGRALGLFHRDVTPSNVLLSLEGELRLTDFGLAHAPGAFGLLSDEEVAQGTPRYVTPEAANGQQPDGRSDLFQAALLLLEMLGCEVRVSVATLEAIRGEQLRSCLPELLAGRAGAFEPVLAQALDVDPMRRFATAADMRAAWRAASSELPEPVTPADEPPREQPPDARTETLRSWLRSSFPDLVRREQQRVARALRRS